MSRIDELIEELCPEGVPSLRMDDLGSLYSGLSGKSKLDFQDGNATYVSYLDIGNNPSLPSVLMSKVRVNDKERQNSISQGDLLFTASSEDREGIGLTSEVEFEPREPIYLNSFCFGWRPNSGIFAQGFLKHLFRSYKLRRDIMRCANGVTRINISKKGVLEIRIPVPPLEIQREIVSILDKFTQLEAELEAELEARRIQYEVTRDKLLDFSDAIAPHPMSEVIRELCSEGVPFHRLDELFDVRGGFTPSKSEAKFWSMGTIPWFRMEDIREGGRILNSAAQMVSSSAAKSGGAFEADSIIISTSATIGEHALVTVPFLANQRFSVLTRKREFRDAIDPKYAFYIGFKLSEYCKENTSVSSFAGVVMSSFKAFQFPLPPLEIQTEIVSILDKLDALVNDITIGLPAEIAARRKQYEFYRNKLLTFKELEAA